MEIFMVEISVIMPIYNVSYFLNKSIESIQNQSIEDIEIICVDDGSTDDSVEVLEKLQKKYNNITIITQENSGPGGARNNGILHASGDYIAFLDGDDIFLDTQALEKMYSTAKKYDFCPLVCANLRRIEQDYSVDEYYDYLNSKFHYFLKEDIVDVESYGIPFGFYKNIFNREFLLENNILFPDYRFGEDPLFMINVLEKIDNFPVVPVDLYGYNHSIGGGVNEKITTYEKKYDYILNFKRIFDILIKNNYQKILSGYKKEFINYLIYSDNMLDSDIKEIVQSLFENYDDYFSKGDYGFFVMEYLLNSDDILENSNDDEYQLIKKCLFEETCIEGNFIGVDRLRNFFDSVSLKFDEDNLDVISYHNICEVKSDLNKHSSVVYDEVESLNENIKVNMFDKNAEHLKKFLECRIDIKNYGTVTNNIHLLECDDSLCNIYQPRWFKNNEGIGTVINSVKGNLNLKFECINDGNLIIDFKSIDYRDKEGNRIPIFIDYTDIKIDGENIIDGRVSSWHDEPFVYETEVVDGQIVNIEVNWLPLNVSTRINIHSDEDPLLSKFLECRVDVKNYGSSDNNLEVLDCDDVNANISRPSWFNDFNGIGYVINSIAGNLNLNLQCIKRGNLKFEFKGIDYRDRNNNRIPIFIDYTEISIDGKNILDENVVAWHDDPFTYNMQVDDNQVVNLQFSWLPLNNHNDSKNLFTKRDIDYMDNMIQSKDIEINNLRNELNHLTNENERLTEFKSNVLNSNSWKITEPLRKLKGRK